MYVSATLPYSAEALRAFLAGHHAAIWPAQIAAGVLLVVLLVEMMRPAPWSVRLAGLILAVFWAWTGGVFYLLGFARLSFLAPGFGVAFLLQAALMLAVAALGGGLVFRRRGNPTAGAGMVLLALALVVYPLAMVAVEGQWASYRLAGVTPLATALLTLGVVCMTSAGWRLKAALSAVPTLQALASAYTAWILTTL